MAGTRASMSKLPAATQEPQSPPVRQSASTFARDSVWGSHRNDQEEIETWPAPLKPELLQKLERFIEDELAARGCPRTGPDPAGVRLAIYRECFQFMIESFTKYKPLLTEILREFDYHLTIGNESITARDQLKARVATIESKHAEAIAVIQQRSQDDHSKLRDEMLALRDGHMMEVRSAQARIMQLQEEKKRWDNEMREANENLENLERDLAKALADNRKILQRTRILFGDVEGPVQGPSKLLLLQRSVQQSIIRLGAIEQHTLEHLMERIRQVSYMENFVEDLARNLRVEWGVHDAHLEMAETTLGEYGTKVDDMEARYSALLAEQGSLTPRPSWSDKGPEVVEMKAECGSSQLTVDCLVTKYEDLMEAQNDAKDKKKRALQQQKEQQKAIAREVAKVEKAMNAKLLAAANEKKALEEKMAEVEKQLKVQGWRGVQPKIQDLMQNAIESESAAAALRAQVIQLEAEAKALSAKAAEYAEEADAARAEAKEAAAKAATAAADAAAAAAAAAQPDDDLESLRAELAQARLDLARAEMAQEQAEAAMADMAAAHEAERSSMESMRSAVDEEPPATPPPLVCSRCARRMSALESSAEPSKVPSAAKTPEPELSSPDAKDAGTQFSRRTSKGRSTRASLEQERPSAESLRNKTPEPEQTLAKEPSAKKVGSEVAVLDEVAVQLAALEALNARNVEAIEKALPLGAEGGVLTPEDSVTARDITLEASSSLLDFEDGEGGQRRRRRGVVPTEDKNVATDLGMHSIEVFDPNDLGRAGRGAAERMKMMQKAMQKEQENALAWKKKYQELNQRRPEEVVLKQLEETFKGILDEDEETSSPQFQKQNLYQRLEYRAKEILARMREWRRAGAFDKNKAFSGGSVLERMQHQGGAAGAAAGVLMRQRRSGVEGDDDSTSPYRLAPPQTQGYPGPQGYQGGALHHQASLRNLSPERGITLGQGIIGGGTMPVHNGRTASPLKHLHSMAPLDLRPASSGQSPRGGGRSPRFGTSSPRGTRVYVDGEFPISPPYQSSLQPRPVYGSERQVSWLEAARLDPAATFSTWSQSQSPPQVSDGMGSPPQLSISPSIQQRYSLHQAYTNAGAPPLTFNVDARSQGSINMPYHGPGVREAPSLGGGQRMSVTVGSKPTGLVGKLSPLRAAQRFKRNNPLF